MDNQISTQDNVSNIDDSNEIDSICELDFDELYVDFYIATKNKSGSYKKACKCIGYEYNAKYVTQYAQSVHKRLLRSGAIQQALQAHVVSDQVGGRLKLNDLRENADSENIQYQVAKHQTGNLYSEQSQSAGIEVHVNRDNVQIKAGKDTLTIENNSK